MQKVFVISMVVLLGISGSLVADSMSDFMDSISKSVIKTTQRNTETVLDKKIKKFIDIIIKEHVTTKDEAVFLWGKTNEDEFSSYFMEKFQLSLQQNIPPSISDWFREYQYSPLGILMLGKFQTLKLKTARFLNITYYISETENIINGNGVLFEKPRKTVLLQIEYSHIVDHKNILVITLPFSQDDFIEPVNITVGSEFLYDYIGI
ncbi:hypothetical protein SDC9_106373 [bioreactor metagenome]|uniref:Uncharacterized protein n=1 Tax=bioreactor metagenome TaxID=1076179 RepID=A0A645B290_9ZZZZ